MLSSTCMYSCINIFKLSVNLFRSKIRNSLKICILLHLMLTDNAGHFPGRASSNGHSITVYVSYPGRCTYEIQSKDEL